MRKQKVEQYILNGYQHKEGHSVESNLLRSGIVSCIISLIIWIIFHLIAFYSNLSMRIWSFNLIMIVLIPIVIFSTFKLLNSNLANYESNTEKQSMGKQNIVTIFSILGSIIGMGVARTFLPNITNNTLEIIINIIAGFLIIIFIFVAIMDFYKIHLIRKYCPRLRKKQTRLY